ncbi:HD-GYP domain-containing protein [Anaerospora sp.]|uniref:HD-GYP domain-containing protein n=1 Tax=Anaerospora sp. TaxID=1960278 RepID=UPI00289CBC4C|nr:HD-GYP domain-containing protein [Anaerospora sp.]
MQEIAIGALKPGMELAQQISSPDEKISLGQGAILTEAWISKFKEWGRSSVRIACQNRHTGAGAQELDVLLQQVFELAAPDKSRSVVKSNQSVYEELQTCCQYVESQLRRIYLMARCGRPIPLRELEQLAKEKLYPLLDRKGAFIYIHASGRADAYLYRHAIDVALLVGFIGRWLGYSEAEVRNLVYAGLVLDIGKAKVAFEIISKSGPLTLDEMELSKKHVRHSLQLLLGNEMMEKAILDGILQHHERIDGLGYPLGLDGNKISPFARILAIADVYDALVSDRYYRQGISPIDAVYTMMYEMSGYFDSHVLGTFIDRMRQQLVGASVELTNGATGKITFFEPFPNLQPVVTLEDGIILDLSSRSDIAIAMIKVT